MTNVPENSPIEAPSQPLDYSTNQIATICEKMALKIRNLRLASPCLKHSKSLAAWCHDCLVDVAKAVLVPPSTVRVALQKIADNYGGCHCDHTTEECCENPKVGEFCPHCIAEIALASNRVGVLEKK